MQSDQNGLLPQLMLRCALSCVVFDWVVYTEGLEGRFSRA